MATLGELLDPLERSELRDVIEMLVKEYGVTAMDTVDKYIKHRHSGSVNVVEVNHLPNVSSSKNGSSNAIAKFKAEKKLKNTKSFDMTRCLESVLLLFLC